MNTTDKLPLPQAPSDAGSTSWVQPAWTVLLKRLAIWALFFALVYLARDFFFAAFMTFLFCYLTLAVVGRGMKRLSPDRDRPWLRRLLTVAVYLLVPLGLLGIGLLVAPRLIEQGKHLAGWLGQVSPETEVARVLEGYIGPEEFKEKYGNPKDPRYQKALEEFRKSGESHVAAYNDFPKLESWVEGGFSTQFAEAERGRIRARLMHEETSSKDFEQWFLKDKVPQLQEQARKQVPDKGRPTDPVDPLVRAAASSTPQQLLEVARHNPDALPALRKEWLQDALAQGMASAKQSPAYQEQFGAYYADLHAKSPKALPYTLEQYLVLQKARPQGRRTFGDTLEKMMPTAHGESEARLRADFETAKKHDLFQEWWGTSSIAKFVRQHVEPTEGGAGGAMMERVVSSLLNVPVDLGTALLLSFFICIDFPKLRQAAQRLRETWLRDVYDEFVPAFSSLGKLVGRAMHAQGLVSLCNATCMFIALTFLGVEHAVLLSGAVFILCLVPTLGMVIAWLLIAVVAVIQPGGGLALAAKVSAAVLLVVLLETFVFSPRLLGRMMELHPVLMIALLPLAQYFFGVWGLILATPVAVYVIHVLILRSGLPGIDAPHEPAPSGPAAGAGSTGAWPDRGIDEQKQKAAAALAEG
jgi:predicted PurR-regulated permease PerM